MATILDDEDTIEAHVLSTSLDPYGQLMKMLMPRALCLAIYDRMGVPIWLSDGCEGPDLLQLVEEALNAVRGGECDPEEREGFARSWDGDTAYVFILRNGEDLLGAVALSSRDTTSGARPFSLMVGLLRPALQVLSRELLNQYNPGEPRAAAVRERTPRTEPELQSDRQFDTATAVEQIDSDDFSQLLHNCVENLGGALGALLIPDKRIELSYSPDAARQRSDAELLERTQRHLFAWAQVQRRTLMLNKAPPNSPLGTLPQKLLACPITDASRQVAGLLALFRPLNAPDFAMHDVRFAELVARRIGWVLQTAYDTSSGLLTRPAFEQRALAVLGAKDARAEHCVAYADVDRLHAINENHGMHVGDAAIEHIAETLRASLAPHLLGSRISGDRFALFLPDTTLESARQFVESLCAHIASLDFRHDAERIGLSMSFGIARVPETKLPLSHAIAAAEVACKAAKERGRNCVELYGVVERSEPEAPARRYDDGPIIGSLREAIANDRFRMDAQPIATLGGGGAPRFELLLRMIEPGGEIVAPDKFLSAAERNHVAIDVDRWVIGYALEILSSAAPALERMGAQFAINISGQSLGDEHFPAYLESKLREYALAPDLLSFEIAETAAVANIVRAEVLIRRLQDLGHAIALDDFGRGLSSLTYLKSLSVSDLKIDGGLIRDLAGPTPVGNGRSQATVSAIVQLGQTMKLRTTAKCVESEAILAAVGKLGVDLGQGFAIGRPQSLETVLRELLRGAPGVIRKSGSPLMSRLAAG